ncbi:hypothetical protein Sango_3002300 [Sesamum angolense]|uniref:WAT1-related protein n=1 Tax=Sesamum angolense TaxID=2727404 RepID=A0AAE1T4L8_9LAMI|nr:hypothetical protein Sango_3002300 [Sesamum angolense]
MEMVKKWIMEGRVGAGMVVVQGITTGLQLLARVILSEGTFVFALMAYRHVVAAFAVLPFALYFERGAVKKLSIAAFFWLFMVALTGNPLPGDWLGIFSFLPFSTRLIGMGLIIAGLYSFLWGKSKDTKPTLLPIKESGAGGGGDAAPESAGLPSSATIVPAASPN